MQKQKLITDFTKYTDKELDEKVSQIIEALTTEPAITYFPTPQPAITVVEDKLEVYSDALANIGKGTLSTGAKNLAREDLETTMSSLGFYLEQASGGSLVKKLSTRFDLSKIRTPKGELPAPDNVTLEPSRKGKLEGRCEPVDGARSYNWYIRQVGQEVWKDFSTTKARILFEDLESGKEYEMKVVAVGSNPVRNFSKVVTSFAV